MNQPSGQEQKIPDEELYIDAKLGFSILHPLNWERIKIPVSSPSYRANEVNWSIPSPESKGRATIQVLRPLESADKLEAQMEEASEDLMLKTDSEQKTFEHNLGHAVSWSATVENKVLRRVAINGIRNAYALTFVLPSNDPESTYTLLDRIVNSLQEL